MKDKSVQVGALHIYIWHKYKIYLVSLVSETVKQFHIKLVLTSSPR